jgi:hypothetical protein
MVQGIELRVLCLLDKASKLIQASYFALGLFFRLCFMVLPRIPLVYDPRNTAS